MEQPLQQKRKYRAKGALLALCKSADQSHSGFIAVSDFKGFANQVQVYLPEDVMRTVREKFGKEGEKGVEYRKVVEGLDWNPIGKQWVLMKEGSQPSVSPAKSQSTSTRKQVLRLM